MRRGFTAGTVVAVLEASTSGAKAAVPATLVRSAMAAATGGAASTTAAVSTVIIWSLLMSRLKVTATGLLAVAALASEMAVAIGAARPEPPKTVMNMQAGADMERHPTAGGALTPASVRAEMMEVRGRVVDPDGRPVARATIQAVYPGVNRDLQPGPESTGPDGWFFVRVPPPRYVFDSLQADAMRARGDMTPWIIAYAPGFGPSKTGALREPGEMDELTIRLVEEGPPIEGRIIDLEGRPVAGARVKVARLWFARQGPLSGWLAHAADRSPRNPWLGLEMLPTISEIPIDATTSPDGRFRLAGLGRERIAQVSVSAATIATAELLVLTGDGPAVSIVENPGRTLTVTAVDPEGRPIGGTKATGRTDLLGSGPYEQASPMFEVRALDPSRPRRVTVSHAGRKLAGSIDLKGDETGPMTVRIQPWGTITGRIVDHDGQPRGGLELFGIRIGRDGRFRIEGLVPGRKYEASAVEGFRGLGTVFSDVTVAPGETKDLGDLKVVSSKEG
jgi:hypothetical protein